MNPLTRFPLPQGERSEVREDLGVEMEFRQKKVLMTSKGISKTLATLAQEIVKKENLEEIALIGIRCRGVPLAERLAKELGKLGGENVPLGILDITLYRDDLSLIASQPIVKETKLPFGIDDKVLILVDDVLFTGRTVRSALDALIDFGRPQGIRLAVLIDRGNRELPIQADYIGKKISTSFNEMVKVELKEVDGKDEVSLWEERK